MRIGVDIMGGDFAPQSVVQGAILAAKELPAEVKLVLIGDESVAKEIIAQENYDSSVFEFVHTTEQIEMGEHPAKAFQKKPNSSIAVGFGLLGSKKIDAFASAGNTGAMLVGTMYTVKSIPGVIRPGISTIFPRPNDKIGILLDVGLNPDCKPDVLYQYGILGSIYARDVYKIANPRVGLLNIGSEDEKGNLIAKATFELMKDSKDFNFVGNIEGYDIFSNEKADVMICDGFVGNIVLKQAEAFYELIKQRNIVDEYFEKFNSENYGGTPVLGINSTVIIGHGASTPKAIQNMILHTKVVIEAHLTEKFKEYFK